MDIETFQQRATDILQSVRLMIETVQSAVASVSQQNLTSLEERLDIIQRRLNVTAVSANDLSMQVRSGGLKIKQTIWAHSLVGSIITQMFIWENQTENTSTI